MTYMTLKQQMMIILLIFVIATIFIASFRRENSNFSLLSNNLFLLVNLFLFSALKAQNETIVNIDSWFLGFNEYIEKNFPEGKGSPGDLMLPKLKRFLRFHLFSKKFEITCCLCQFISINAVGRENSLSKLAKQSHIIAIDF